MPNLSVFADAFCTVGLGKKLALLQGFGEEKTSQIREKTSQIREKLAKTNFFQWFDAYKATQNKP